MIRLPADRITAANYFTHLSEHPTSARTKGAFSKLPEKPSAAEQLAHVPTRLVANWTPKEIEVHLGKIASLHDQWLSEFYLGFNLVLHGYGSKVRVLEGFFNKASDRFHCFSLRVHQRDASFSSFLGLVLRTLGRSKDEEGLEESLSVASRNYRAVIQKIENLLETSDVGPFILLFIHQIDAPYLRAPAIQDAIAMLSRHPSIRLICTVEHCNPHGLWSASQASAFNFLWHDATTFIPYKDELAALVEGRGRGCNGERTSLASCKTVLEALPRSAQGIFQILVDHQLALLRSKSSLPLKGAGSSDSDDSDMEEGDEDWEEKAIQGGLSFHAWYQAAQEAFLANSDLTFRTQLVEFTDHNLVRTVENPMAAGHLYYLPFSADELAHVKKF